MLLLKYLKLIYSHSFANYSTWFYSYVQFRGRFLYHQQLLIDVIGKIAEFINARRPMPLCGKVVQV